MYVPALFCILGSADMPGEDRMPVPLGNFISRTVYDSQLKSEHRIQDIKTSKCVLFVDVRKGSEERAGESWKVRIRAYMHVSR